ncbi:hypothetical protein JIN77_10870 [Verrucomicrobiaceae bacterium R5-34]|nr:hypothetical protein [Verrucomicrobiaceae bacterium R5-34]
MNHTSIAGLLTAIALCTPSLHAQSGPLNTSEVLQLTLEQLAEKLGDQSEVGHNEAAQIWATAQRIQTDAVLGKTSVQAVRELNQWRQVLNDWSDLKLRVRAVHSGGGTMWSHLSARNDAPIESFLAKHQAALSAPPTGKRRVPKINYLKPLIQLIDAGLKEWDAGEYQQQEAAALKKELETTHSYLIYMLQGLTEGATRQAVIELVQPDFK